MDNTNEPGLSPGSMRFIEREILAVSAYEHLMNADVACTAARAAAEKGRYLIAAQEAQSVHEEAVQARRLLMRAFFEEAEDLMPSDEPSEAEEEKAELAAECARIEASEDLLAACEVAVEFVVDEPISGESQDTLKVLYAAIAKARPGV